MFIQFLCGLSIIFSGYALFIEYKASKNSKYKAICDINAHASCTKAFTSEFGHMLGIPNSVMGIGFYLSVLILSGLGYRILTFSLALIGVLSSVILAYILYFKLKNFCLICNIIYFLNILLLWSAWL